MVANKIALVTGGGNGIGRALCRLLARNGARVVAADRVSTSAQETVNSLSNPRSHLALELDVSDKSSVETGIKCIIETFKAPPSLVANVAGITRDFPILQMDERAFTDVIDVNLKGTFLVTQAAVKALVEHGGKDGAIVNVSSISSKGNYGQANYSASKAGVEAFTRTAAIELAKLGVRVNCVMPGFTRTAMVETVPEKVKQQILMITPLKRFGQPEEVAEVIAFLLSDKSSFMTGASVKVTGGM
ncbi:hypothetical protein Pcinc_022341 [Petrolisthes cinctipes]|uniref:(3R)-3-hydroxyacyl-CoA dehydrogenase n=1 Tax=Petrolisthes cinctipes TaxID=88211 RepID=A0AAE1FGA0_PETCI|nr:hypothetical protein Pcinc_022341 [Petrolisthes cinctipes]